jgi:hypothetical protein
VAPARAHRELSGDANSSILHSKSASSVSKHSCGRTGAEAAVRRQASRAAGVDLVEGRLHAPSSFVRALQAVVTQQQTEHDAAEGVSVQRSLRSSRARPAGALLVPTATTVADTLRMLHCAG